MLEIPRPCKEEVVKYLELWDTMERYVLHERCLNKLFHDVCSDNDNMEDVLIKVKMLNDFYSTRILAIIPMAKHILSLDIDNRLKEQDESLVDDIANVVIGDKKRRFYSFATKYCSHHDMVNFPIYDKYVDKILRYFRNKDNFAEFKNVDLKDYSKFKKILMQFKKFYKIDEYNLKDIDRYIWQLGKEYFKSNKKIGVNVNGKSS